jgi:outer membrane lipopolysaccharide assembly protein LptE/RlpB
LPLDSSCRATVAACAILFAALLALGGCGYHVVGRASTLPANLPADVHTIAVPTFQNATTTYRIEQRLTDAVVHELLARTKYHVVAREEDGDAVLRGNVLTITSAPVIFDATTGAATTILVTVTISVQLQDRATGNVLYHNENVVFREPYEISTDIPSFFEEEGPALDRLSRDFASRVVATLLENF